MTYSECRKNCTVHDAADCRILTGTTAEKSEHEQVQACIKAVQAGKKACLAVRNVWGSDLSPDNFETPSHDRFLDPNVSYFGPPRTLLEGYLDHARGEIDRLHGEDDEKKSGTDESKLRGSDLETVLLKRAWGRTLAAPRRVHRYCERLAGLINIPKEESEIVKALDKDVASAKKAIETQINNRQPGDGAGLDYGVLRGVPLQLLDGILGPRSRHWLDHPGGRLRDEDREKLEQFDKNVRLPFVEAAATIVEDSGNALIKLAFPNLQRDDPGLFRILVVDDFYPLLFHWFDRMAALEPWEFKFLARLPRPEKVGEEFDLPREKRVLTTKLADQLGLNKPDAKPWHLVLLDIDFGWQGYGNVALDYLAALRKLLPKTPVLMASRWAYLDAAVPYFEAGAAGYLCKYTRAYVDAEAIKHVHQGKYEPDRFAPEHWRQTIKKTLEKRWSVRQILVPNTIKPNGNNLTVGRTIVIDDVEFPDVAYLPKWRPEGDAEFGDWCERRPEEAGFEPAADRSTQLAEYVAATLEEEGDDAVVRATSIAEGLTAALVAEGRAKDEAPGIALASLPLFRRKDPEPYIFFPLELKDRAGRVVAVIRTPDDAEDEAYYANKIRSRLLAGAARALREGRAPAKRLFTSVYKDLAYMVVPEFPLLSLFDILGPDMTGPSSSHTAGACRIGRLARSWLKALPTEGMKDRTLEVLMEGSFRTTGEGHRSDAAVLGGLLGWWPSNANLKDARGCFQLEGPDMTGPSSSHTAGACRIGRLARSWLKALPTEGMKDRTLEVLMEGSFRTTGEGHRSDAAVLGGLLGWWPSNANLKDARGCFQLEKARKTGKNLEEGTWPPGEADCAGHEHPANGDFPGQVHVVWDRPGSSEQHPNTIRFKLVETGDWLTCRSWGGGNVQISGIGRGDKKGSTLSESDLNRDTKRFSGLRSIYVTTDWELTEENPDGGGQFTIAKTMALVQRGTEPALETTLWALAGEEKHVSTGTLPITVGEPISCTYCYEEEVDKREERRKVVVVLVDFQFKGAEDGFPDGGGQFTIAKTMALVQRGTEPALETTLWALAGEEKHVSTGTLPITVGEPISCTYCYEEEVDKREERRKVVVVLVDFQFKGAEDQDRESTGVELIWQRALQYEQWVSSREAPDVRTGTGGAAVGKGVEPPLNVRRALGVMLCSVVDGLDNKDKDKDKERGARCVFDDAEASGLGSAAYAYAYSLAVQQRNAGRERIIAAPTAGACGIVPGALFAVALTPGEFKAAASRRMANGDAAPEDVLEGLAEDKLASLENALLTSAMIGLVINNIVPTAGAMYGCQAETGVGAAMAAAAVCEYLGGKPVAVVHAAALALKNSIGLTCDPVAGRVEVPCIKRSGMKAVEAVMAGRAAYQGMRSRIGPDEVVWVLKEAGDEMPDKFKETALGGLAQTLSGRAGCPTCGGPGCSAGTCPGGV